MSLCVLICVAKVSYPVVRLCGYMTRMFVYIPATDRDSEDLVILLEKMNETGPAGFMRSGPRGEEIGSTNNAEIEVTAK